MTTTNTQKLEQLKCGKLGDCQRCDLHKGREQLVFGEGDSESSVMFVGEGPGAHEDHLGRPFVGDAGVVLNNLIQHGGMERPRVYITNVVKCRPPGNRDPEPEEIAACLPFLRAQIAIIRPNLLVALGRIAGNILTGQSPHLSAEVLQERLWTYEHTDLRLSIPVVCLYHPAFLYRKLGTDAIKTLYPEAVTRLKRAVAMTKPVDLGL